MDHRDLHERQRRAIVDGETELAVELAQEAIDVDADLGACVDHGFAKGIREVGRLWEEGEFFLPELVQGADAMKAAMAVLRPEFLKDQDETREEHTVVLGTAAGDIHDIGKALVGTVLEANGFLVVDLGKDVANEAFVEAVVSETPAVLGMSALLTTTMPRHGEVIELLKARGLRDQVKVIVGGAPVTRAFADGIGADDYGANAMEALSVVRRLIGIEA